MTTVTCYRSSDASAPTLTGQVGSLLGVLDACLVNGYGTQSAAGWSKPFSNSGNVGCYKNAGTGYCLAVNDNGPGGGGAEEARVTGFASMASVSTGSGQFPTAAQSTIGAGQLVVRKSTAATSTARNWTVVADGTCFYMWAETGDQTAPFAAYGWMFGDFFTYSSSDTNNCAIIARPFENSANSASANGVVSNAAALDAFGLLTGAGIGALSYLLGGHYCAANFTNVGGSIQFGKHSDQIKQGSINNASGTGNGSTQQNYIGFCGQTGSNQGTFPSAFNYPNPPDNGLYVAPIWVHHNGFVRGYLKGLWCPLQHLPLNHNDTYSGTGNLSGKSFLAQNTVSPAPVSNTNQALSAPSQVHVETSSTWS